MMFTPRADAARDASWQMPLEAPRQPAGTLAEGHVASIVRASNTSWSTWRSFSVSALRRIGWGMTSWWQWSGVSPSRLISGPMQASRLITTDSRIGSMAGLVTCAKSCLK